MRVAPDNEIHQIPIDQHRDSRFGKDTPHRAWQAPPHTNFSNPTPALLIDRKGEARSKYGQRLLGIPPTSEVDAADGGLREATAELQQLANLGRHGARPMGLEISDRLAPKPRHWKCRQLLTESAGPRRRK
jgi:hypothetical protein